MQRRMFTTMFLTYYISLQVKNMICHSAVSYLANSDVPVFLPDPEGISFIIDKVIYVGGRLILFLFFSYRMVKARHLTVRGPHSFSSKK